MFSYCNHIDNQIRRKNTPELDYFFFYYWTTIKAIREFHNLSWEMPNVKTRPPYLEFECTKNAFRCDTTNIESLFLVLNDNSNNLKSLAFGLALSNLYMKDIRVCE